MRILEIFKGDKGEFSSKRMVGIIGALCLIGAMLYYHTDKIIESVEWVTILSLGFTTIDKFGNNGKQI